MIDIKRIKEDPQGVIELYAKKEKDAKAEIERILELDEQRRALIQQTEAMKSEQNKVSKSVPALKKAGEDVAPVFAKMKELASQIKAQDEKLGEIEKEYRTLMLALPNLPDEDLAPGGKENNEPIRYFGEPSTTLICALTLDSLITTEVPSLRVAASGCTEVSAPVWSGLCSTILSIATLPTAMSLLCLLICLSTSAVLQRDSSPSLPTRSIR